MIKGWIVGDRELIARLQAAPRAINDALYETVDRLSIKLLAIVKEQKLSGGVLKARSGLLRRRTTYRVVREGTGVYGVVGTNVKYGAVHEYGFKGTVDVRAHLREVKQAFGKPLSAAKNVFVRGHTRKVNLPERSFLRSALREMRPEIERSMGKAMLAAAKRVLKD
jgi:phage gpG-like protein